MEVLKQPQYQPLPVEKQVMIIYAANNGFVDAYPTNILQRYEKELFAFLDEHHDDLQKTIAEKKIIDAETEDRIKAVLGEFKEKFVA